MKCRSKLSLIAASLSLAAFSAHAIEANIGLKDLPSLSPEVQHETASKRVTSFLELLTTSISLLMTSYRKPHSIDI